MYKVITISREYGSGGRYVGRILSEKLGIPFYDKELIDMMAEKSHYSAEYIKENEDKKTKSFLYTLSTEGVLLNNPYSTMAPDDKLFLIQNNLINELAEKGACIIIGRCADYILRDRDDVMNVFITCDMPHRIERCVKYYGIEEKDAQKVLKKKDRGRAAKYSYYAGKDWGVAKNYDVTLNSGSYGVEKCADIIAELYNSAPEK